MHKAPLSEETIRSSYLVSCRDGWIVDVGYVEWKVIYLVLFYLEDLGLVEVEFECKQHMGYLTIRRFFFDRKSTDRKKYRNSQARNKKCYVEKKYRTQKIEQKARPKILKSNINIPKIKRSRRINIEDIRSNATR